jgi:2-polyprenyl-3-methyl-5-hydroxy-6-metoxy-1,4-benzoquinol methylase
MACLLAQLAMELSDTPLVLEIGPGNGLTSLLLSAQGICVEVADTDQQLCEEMIKKYHIQAHCTNFEDYRSDYGYHLIYAGHVLEHSIDPLKFLKNAYDILQSKGILYIDTPNTLCIPPFPHIWKHFNTRNPYEHCCLFTSKTLDRAAKITGFFLEHITPNPQYESLQAILRKP